MTTVLLDSDVEVSVVSSEPIEVAVEVVAADITVDVTAMTDINVEVIGVPGSTGFVTWPTGSEPSLVGVTDGTVWIEYQP